ncbi:nitrate reductase cytochrome c-type subunit [Shewanella sp. NIFS-20-20]|uniref:nitrate reductase cytochrome c-type subunit n=1 Tax=Shewanella sp. NIFS-20-20 TaxID=2853806 RepID=UPI001C44A4BD|nr:nitrate reductase cytochrome c-type subunit [Shewanella sp. NIFS-20-20]MBV7314093.1 nitrate reductase cytochrome c-type subunit [Shewanella sp. NIFS-20-20]
MKKLMTMALFALSLTACSGQQPPAAAPVNVKSLAGDSRIEDIRPADAMPQYPSRGKAIVRDFQEQPPLIPHKADYAINADKNTCMNCHSWDKASRMKATPVAKSHVIDDKGTLNGANYFCSLCHVPQADNKQAIVENEFSH